jgi:hypothetical protein
MIFLATLCLAATGGLTFLFIRGHHLFPRGQLLWTRLALVLGYAAVLEQPSESGEHRPLCRLASALRGVWLPGAVCLESTRGLAVEVPNESKAKPPLSTVLQEVNGKPVFIG